MTLRRLFRLSLIAAPALFVPAAMMAKPTYIPVVSGNFSTGQWYFEGERSSLGGNAHLTFVPALRFSDRFSLIPTFETTYRGTRSAEELAGGNTFFQDTWENAASVKGVHSLGSGWKIRESAGARIKLFRETTDEALGDGLYDYQIYNVGTEIEHAWSKRTSVALGYDYSLLFFPNYQSLESEQAADQAREFAGDDVLDSRVQLITTRVAVPLSRAWSLDLQGYFSPRHYPDQNAVNLTGLLVPTERKDEFSGATLSAERLFETPKRTRLLATLYGSYSALDSNQNHYDARQTAFVADFFDYDQRRIGAALSFAFAGNHFGPAVAEMGGFYSRRDYRSRVIQNASGAYQSEKLWVAETALNVGFSYPLTKFVRARTAATFGRSRSNNDYEELYRYNFNNANYQFGFTYEY